MDDFDSDKRQATRKSLLTAARELVFEKGHNHISIQEITGQARLATGTFYNYFDTKQDIFLAVAKDMQEELTQQLDVTRSTIKDPAMLVSVTLKYYFYQVLDNEEWNEFVHRVGLADLSLQQDAEQCIEDIERGMKAGRFRLDDVYFTQNLIAGIVNHVSREIQKGSIGRNGIEYAIRSILQMLGLPDLVSKALTQTPLPPIAAAKRVRPSQVGEVTSIIDYTSAKKTI